MCNTCLKTFRHLPLNKLYHSTSDIAGQGLFANVQIAKGTMIIRFQGRKTRPEAECDGFALQLDSQTWIIPSGNHRYVNHSCEPNAALMKWTDHKRSLVVSIVALKDIVKDGEICVHYGAHHDLPTGRQPCHCNAPGCVARNKKRNTKSEAQAWQAEAALCSKLHCVISNKKRRHATRIPSATNK